jgi:hypothetical protein
MTLRKETFFFTPTRTCHRRSARSRTRRSFGSLVFVTGQIRVA